MGIYQILTYDPNLPDEQEAAVRGLGYFWLRRGEIIVRFGGHGEGFDEADWDTGLPTVHFDGFSVTFHALPEDEAESPSRWLDWARYSPQDPFGTAPPWIGAIGVNESQMDERGPFFCFVWLEPSDQTHYAQPAHETVLAEFLVMGVVEPPHEVRTPEF